VTGLSIFEIALGGLFVVFGLLSASSSLREPVTFSGGARFMLAVHDAAKAGFWLALGGFFIGYALLEHPQRFRWFALVPLGMAALRLVAAYFLSRPNRTGYR
jgi:hypothetical protein